MVSYLKGMFDKFAYTATWLPNAPLELGDVGVLSDGFFQRVTSLKSLGIDFTVRKGASAVDLSHSSEKDVTVSSDNAANAELKAADAKANAKVTVEFGAKGAFVFQAKGCVESAIEDQAKLGREIIARFKSGENWDASWVVINTVVEAESATIMVSNSTTSKIEIGANANLPPGSAALADANIGLRVTSQTGDVMNILAAKSLTPMFRVSRIKQGLIAKIQRSLFGTNEFENVRSIGPQVFSAGDEPDAEATDPDEESPLEDVKPE